MTFYKRKHILVSAAPEEIEKTLHILSAYRFLEQISNDMFKIRIDSGIPSLFNTAVCVAIRGTITQTAENTFEICYEIRPPAVTWLFLTVCSATFIEALVYYIKKWYVCHLALLYACAPILWANGSS